MLGAGHTDLPVVMEVVDDQAHIDRLRPILDEMIAGGARVTMSRVAAREGHSPCFTRIRPSLVNFTLMRRQ